MFKKFLKLIKKNESNDNVPLHKEEKVEVECNSNEEIAITIEAVEENHIQQVEIEESKEESVEEEVIAIEESKEESVEEEVIAIEEPKEEVEQEVIDDIDLELILEAKIKREKNIKAIDVYTKEEAIFKTHKECSKKLKLPLGYIKENLKYGYTEYFGDAITYLSNQLQSNEEDDFAYLNSSKTPSEQFNILHNKIFTARISENKRDEILSSDKIETTKMHYTFECIDEEYDDYFRKYKAIIKRGGKKKIELIDKKGEVLDVFKTIEDCANHIGKEKNEVVELLKYGENKVGRHEIRYSLRNI